MSKILYEKPSTELLVVRFEESLLTGSPVPGQAGNNDSYNEYPDDF